jgi:outer membrane lipoprotein-sorting protein
VQIRFQQPASKCSWLTAKRGLGALCLAVLLTGCALFAPAPSATPVPQANPEVAQFQQLTDALIERARRLDAMQAEAVMDYAGGGQHVKVREEVTVKRPASLRVEALTPFGVAAVVAANGSTVAIYQPSDNTFYRGAATADTLSRFARIPLPPQQAVKLLMGLLPDPEADFARATSIRTEGDLVVGSYELPGGDVDELGFAGGELRMVRTRGKAGAGYEVSYSDYRDIGGLQFAHRLEAKFLNTGTHLNVSYSGVIVNPSISDSQFVLVPQEKARLIDLDQPAAAAGSHG